MATKKFSDYAIQGNNVTLTYDNVNDTVTFDVNIDKNDVGLGNVDNTSDVNKPISTATQTALDGKASTTSLNAHTSDLNNPHAVTKSQVGLSNVDNTSDANKPISTATQTALDGKQDSLGFTPVTNARTLTINGTTFDLSANRTWSVGDLVSSGSYSNPLWLTSLAWAKITGTPTTLSGYGITDAVTSTRTLTINGTAYDLSADRSWAISTPTLAQVTTAGNTTTNAITVGGLTVANYNTSNSQVKIGSFELQSYSLNNSWLGDNVYYNGTTFVARQTGTTGMFYFYQNEGQFRLSASVSAGTSVGVNNNTQLKINSDGTLAIGSGITTTPGVYTNAKFMVIGATGNVLINTTTDSGYKLDVNGTVRVSGDTRVINLFAYGGINCSSFGYGTGGGDTKSFTTQGVTSGVKVLFSDNNAYNSTANLIHISVGNTSFAPTSGNGRFSALEIIHTINQTGTANGITRGIYINPTLTSAYDFRAIDIQTGSLVLGRMTSDPTVAVNGMIYYNTTLGMFRVYQSGAWKTITAI